jgi:GT2 family glycosyltransferase
MTGFRPHAGRAVLRGGGPRWMSVPGHGLEVPVDVLEVDLAAPTGRERLERQACVLVRRAGIPIGVVNVPAGTGWSEVVAQAEEISAAVPARLPAGVPDARPRATVVITTTCPSERLARTVHDALSQSMAPLRVVVVDNRPAGGRVRAFLESRFGPDVTCVAATLPGLSRARNVGLSAVDTDIVAFTDDDVRLDRDWLRRLVEAFGPEVDCVTGLVMPLALETEAQLLMERFGGFSKGFRPRWFDLKAHRDPNPLYPFAVGVFGTGANAAFRTAALRELGGFDETLGAGRPTRGGEDLDVFLRTVLSSRTIAYEPAALVWHSHESEMGEFRTRMYGYGVGLGAMLTKHLVRSAGVRGELVRRAPGAIRYLLDGNSPKNSQRGRSYPRRFVLLELLGVLVGPFAYGRACLQRLVPDRGPGREGRVLGDPAGARGAE